MGAKGWPVIPFSEGVQINPNVPLEQGKVYPFVDMQAIDPNSRIVRANQRREFTGGGSHFAVGDTLMARITPCLENGKIARFADDDSSALGHGSTEFIVIRGLPEVSDTDFVYYLTRWDDVRQYAIAQMTGTSGRQRVPTESLRHLEIQLPSLPEQRAIAHILGTLDDKIELNRQMNETLEAIARALFKSWFVDFDPVRAKVEGRDPGLPGPIADLFPDRFEDSELGEIPAGWVVRSLDEIAVFLNGLALQNYPPRDGRSLPVIKIAQLHKGNTEGADLSTADLPPEYIVEDGDVLFSWSGSLECVLWTGGRGALNQHLFKVTSGVYPKWLYYLWIHEHLPHFRHIASGKATTMGHIQRYHLSEAKVVIPPSDVLEFANQHLVPLIELITQHSVQSRTLADLRDALLPRLMSGEIRVRDAERFGTLPHGG